MKRRLTKDDVVIIRWALGVAERASLEHMSADLFDEERLMMRRAARNLPSERSCPKAPPMPDLMELFEIEARLYKDYEPNQFGLLAPVATVPQLMKQLKIKSRRAGVAVRQVPKRVRR